MGSGQNRRSQNRETLCVCANARTCRDAASTGAVETQTHGGKHLENTEENVDREWCIRLPKSTLFKLSKPMYLPVLCKGELLADTSNRTKENKLNRTEKVVYVLYLL